MPLVRISNRFYTPKKAKSWFIIKIDEDPDDVTQQGKDKRLLQLC